MPTKRSRPLLAALAGALGGAVAATIMARENARERALSGRLHRVLVDLLLNTLSAGDAATERHSRRVADLTDILAAHLAISGGAHSTLRVAALLHDMGKIDDRFFDILHSCEPLSPEDRDRMALHPGQSADILHPLEAIHPGISRIVEGHHEFWNGSGYPRGLTGEEIPLESRLISVADVFDAMTQARTYRPALSVEETLAEIRKGAGSRFDPEIVEHLAAPEVADRWTAIAEQGRREEAEGYDVTGSPSRSAPSGPP